MFKRISKRYILIAGVAALATFSLAGCHNPQSDFNNMSRDQQLKVMQPSASTLAAGARAATGAHGAAGATAAQQVQAHTGANAGAAK